MQNKIGEIKFRGLFRRLISLNGTAVSISVTFLFLSQPRIAMPVGNDETPTMRELFETAVSKSSSSTSTELGMNLDLLDEGLEHALKKLRTTEEKLRASATVLVTEYNDVEAQYRGHMVVRVDAGKLQRRHRALGERYQNSSWKAKQIGKDLHAAESSRLRAEEALSLLGDFDRYDALARRVQTQLEDDADARGRAS